MDFLRTYKHLLPRAKAWSLTVRKNLRDFFEGLVGLPDDIRVFLDNVWLDIFPETTRELDAWESQWGLPATVTAEQDRRDRLDATWKALGGQDPRYIQDTLRGAGFDVFVHEWWEEGSDPPVLRNPLLHLRRTAQPGPLLVECGEVLAQCGEAVMDCGNSANPLGYPLVNKLFSTEPDVIPLCGEAVAACGEAAAACGNFVQFIFAPRDYIVPDDTAKWPFFFYIGGVSFGDIAEVDQVRRDEFEDLCLKICPTQLWLGILVQYT